MTIYDLLVICCGKSLERSVACENTCMKKLEAMCPSQLFLLVGRFDQIALELCRHRLHAFDLLLRLLLRL